MLVGSWPPRAGRCSSSPAAALAAHSPHPAVQEAAHPPAAPAGYRLSDSTVPALAVLPVAVARPDAVRVTFSDLAFPNARATRRVSVSFTAAACPARTTTGFELDSATALTPLRVFSVNVPISETSGTRGGTDNSVTRIMIKPTHLIGGYAQLSWGFNYYGAIGSQRDEVTIVPAVAGG